MVKSTHPQVLAGKHFRVERRSKVTLPGRACEHFLVIGAEARSPTAPASPSLARPPIACTLYAAVPAPSISEALPPVAASSPPSLVALPRRLLIHPPSPPIPSPFSLQASHPIAMSRSIPRDKQALEGPRAPLLIAQRARPAWNAADTRTPLSRAIWEARAVQMQLLPTSGGR